MPILLAIAGAILYFAGPWFESQETAGLILFIGGAGWFLLQVVWGMIVASQIRKQHKAFENKWKL